MPASPNSGHHPKHVLDSALHGVQGRSEWSGLRWYDRARMSFPLRSLSFSLAAAVAVTRALGEEIARLEDEAPQEPRRRYAYTVLARRLGLTYSALERTVLGERWPILSDIQRILVEPRCGEALRRQWRGIDAGLPLQPENVALGDGSADSWGTMGHMTPAVQELERSAQELIRQLSQLQMLHRQEGRSVGFTADWLAVARQLDAPARPSAPLPRWSLSDQLRHAGCPSLAQIVRDCLTGNAPARPSTIHRHVVQVVDDYGKRRGQPFPFPTRHQVTDVLAYLKRRGEVEADDRGFYVLTTQER